MSRRTLRRTWDAVQSGNRAIAYGDLEALILHLGFRLERVRGSHHIYRHPLLPRSLNLQPRGKDAKPYQVRQLRDMIREMDLKLSDG